jgi:DNA-binding NtrC family response regulator
VFHLVVLDLMMPKISGLDLLQQIRSVDDDIAVIILTGYPSLETASASIQHEVSAYIQKPFTPEEFRDVIARIAKKKGLVLRREDELHAAIGRQIRDLRKARGLTLKQMARRTNLSVSLLSQIERAESSASVSSLFKVATALDVRLTDLFGGY